MPRHAGRDEDPVRRTRRSPARCRARRRAPTGVAHGDRGPELPGSLAVERRRRDARAGSSASPRVLAGSREHRRAGAACRRRSSRAARGRALPGAARACRPPARRRVRPDGVLVDLDHGVARRRGGSPRRPGRPARPRRRCRGASRAGPSRRPPVRRRRGSRRLGCVGRARGAVTSSRLPGRR